MSFSLTLEIEYGFLIWSSFVAISMWASLVKNETTFTGTTVHKINDYSGKSVQTYRRAYILFSAIYDVELPLRKQQQKMHMCY